MCAPNSGSVSPLFAGGPLSITCLSPWIYFAFLTSSRLSSSLLSVSFKRLLIDTYSCAWLHFWSEIRILCARRSLIFTHTSYFNLQSWNGMASARHCKVHRLNFPLYVDIWVESRSSSHSSFGRASISFWAPPEFYHTCYVPLGLMVIIADTLLPSIYAFFSFYRALIQVITHDTASLTKHPL